LERITHAFVYPVRDPQWVSKVLIIGLILLIPIAGAINGLGWMLASLDRLRAGDERLAPANLNHLGRGARLFIVELAYGFGIGMVALVVYLPGVLLAVRQGEGTPNTWLIVLAILLNLVAFGIATLGSLALTFLTPAIVLAVDRGGIAAGLNVGANLRRSRVSVTNTLIAGLMLIAASFVGSLGLIVCVVGVLFTLAYGLGMQAWIIRSFEIGTSAAEAAEQRREGG
jgi:hypothetical protein